MIRFITGALIYFVLAVSGLAQVSVGLAWTASTDNTGVAGYNVYRDGIKIGTSPTTSFTDVNAAENTTYSYTVQAYDKAGNVSGSAKPAVILTGFKHGGGTVVTATDDFNRANGSLGPNWVNDPTFPGPATIVSNQASFNGGTDAVAYWNPATNTFANDQNSQITIGTGSGLVGPLVRGNPISSTYYVAFVFTPGASTHLEIFRVSTSSFVSIGTSATMSIPSGATVKLSAVGTTLTAFVNGVSVATATDATYASGQPGIFLNGTPQTLDDWIAGPVASSGTGDFAFSLPSGSTLKFMSPTGSDAANGLTPATAWATPNHPMKCGEVILAGPGTYSAGQFATKYQQPTSCPSTSGGIDGSGQIWFATILCAGADLEACQITGPTGTGDPQALVDFNVCCISVGLGSTPASNWAIEGFHIDAGNTTPQSGGGCCVAIQPGRACDAPLVNHHIAAINVITSNVRKGISGQNECANWNGQAAGTDYLAAVGMIVQNSVQENYGGFVCIAAIDFVSTGNFDTNPGTHFYAYNNFGMNNHNANCEWANPGNTYDVEFIMIDSPGTHLTTGTHTLANNIGFNSGRSCIQMTQNNAQVLLPINAYNNTCYGNFMLDARATDFFSGEFYIEQKSDLWIVSVYNNIFRADGNQFDTHGALPKFAMFIATFGTSSGGTGLPNYKEGNMLGAGKENILFTPNNLHCDFTCLPTSTLPSIVVYTGDVAPTPTTVGTTAEFYVDPNFVNVADLPNRYGTPNCTGFENTTQCMGWNARTGTLTTPSVISDLTATCAQCTGKGFQRPSLTCGSLPVNADYPAWLKGVVYLHADSGFTAGTTITQKAGLVPKPCGL